MPLSSNFNRFYSTLSANTITDTNTHSFQTAYLRKYWLRRVSETLFIAALIYGCQQHLLINGIFGPLSPATGTALSALFLRGRTLVPGLFLGSLISHLANQIDLSHALLFSFIFTATLFLIRETCLRWVGPVAPLNKVKILFQFIFIAAIFSGIHVLLMNALLIQPIPLYSSWLGEMNGILYLTPLCLLFDPFTQERYFGKETWHWKIFSISLILCQISIFIMPGHSENLERGLSALIFILICLYGYCFAPIPLGITLLGLSVLYLGTPLMQSAYHSKEMITLLTLQALLSFSISLYRAHKKTSSPNLLD